ncbi:hypothetical protein BJV78DRAFT_955483 [Lactifluus subvellereus]|nr:hypothetical protein BJV78DRAFT_955483 [Lactifluus subvellereus]
MGSRSCTFPWQLKRYPPCCTFPCSSSFLVSSYSCSTFTTPSSVWWFGGPYYAPLSSSTLRAYTGVSYGVFHILRFITRFPCFSYETWNRFDDLMHTCRERLWWGAAKRAQETASASSAEIDRRVLRRTFDALDEDHELEQFFECIPGFCSSKVVDDPKGILAEIDDPGLTYALIRFWYHTLTSSFVSEAVKQKRLTICVKAADSARLSDATEMILEDIFRRPMDGVLRSVEIGHSLGSRGNNNNEDSALCAQGIVAGIIASVSVGERDYRWKALVMGQLDVSEDVLRDYLAHGDSVLLANLIHITHQFFPSYLDRVRFVPHALPDILRTISGFDIQNTLPGLQNDFCALWNEIVLEARNRGDHRIPYYILKEIRHIYIALHQGTDSAPTAFSASTDHFAVILYQPSSYPLCNIPGHGSHIHEPVVDLPEDTVNASAATLSNVPHPDAVLTTIGPSAGPDVSPLPTLTPHCSRIRSADEPSLHMSQATTIIESSHLTPPVNLENNQFPAISFESATVAAIPGPADTPTTSPAPSSEFDLHSTLAASTSIAQLLVIPPSSGTVATQHNTELGVVPPSIIPGMPFSSVSTPAPGNPLPPDPQAASASPGSQIDQLTPGPGFIPLGSATAAPQVTSVSHPGMATNDAGFGTHDNSRAPDFSINMEAPHHPHQLYMSVPDIVTELSRHSLDTVPSSRDTNCPGQRDIQP